MDDLESKLAVLNARMENLERQVHEIICALLADDESDDDESLTLEGIHAGKARKDDVL